eukprot:TRINITY_DN12732_c0_g1_i2.p1 TRINITY_DN12732_c0_g1~~TRINITY_DN12732_c0_g1_i2.p1  ORF type:complete len:452 (+),score=103.52 TRINITY_DN12732_c0_g1_i2:99-1454(+)
MEAHRALFARFCARFPAHSWQFVLPLSCSAVDDARSAYQQHDMMGIIPPRAAPSNSAPSSAASTTLDSEGGTSSDSDCLSDRDLLARLLHHATPCKPGTRVPIDPRSPTPACPPVVTLSRDAVRGWVPQNHMDCAAAAMAGGLNAALGLERRGLAFFSTQDVIAVMEVRLEGTLSRYLARAERAWGERKAKHLALAMSVIVNPEHVEPEPGAPPDTESRCAMLDPVDISMLLPPETASSVGLSQLNSLNLLRGCRSVEAFSGGSLASIVKEAGLPLEVEREVGCSFEDIVRWLSEDGVSVLIHIPRHLVLVFAAGSDEDGSHRHLLVGRASGGQSPCSWIPFSGADVLEEGHLPWMDAISVDEGVGGSMQSPHGLCAEGRSFQVIRRTHPPPSPEDDSSPAVEDDLDATAQKYLPYLKARQRVACACCAMGDTPLRAREFMAARKEWLGFL